MDDVEELSGKMSFDSNPWFVHNLDEFLYYCCPQCDHKSKDKGHFFSHASLLHPQSLEPLKFASDYTDLTADEGKNDIEDVKEETGEESNDFIEGLIGDFDDVDEDSEVSLHQCYFCGRHEGTLADMRDHMRRKHRKPRSKNFGIPRPDCPKCNEVFRFNDDGYFHECAPKIKKELMDEDNRAGQSGPDNFQCYMCGQEFDTKDEAVAHLKAVHSMSGVLYYGKPRSIQCHVCKAMFATKARMDRHVCNFVQRSSLSGKPTFCHLCKHNFKSYDTLKYHLATFHVTEKRFSCDLCDHKAKTAMDVTKHRRVVHEKKWRHMCHICGSGADSANTLADHMAVHNNSAEKKHMCEKCGKGFVNYAKLAMHRRYDHPVYDMCTLCEMFFTSRTKLKQHLATEHQCQCYANEDVYVCPVCRKQFDSYESLDLHGRDEHAFDAAAKACTECELAFSSELVWKIHLMKVHARGNPLSKRGPAEERRIWDKVFGRRLVAAEVSGTRPKKGVKCDVCARVLSCPGSLMEHKRQVHDKSNHIKCEKCDYTTFQPSMLRKHFSLKHDTSVTYECDQCPYKCHHVKYMQRHKANVHSKSRKFQCDLCPKGYSIRAQLEHHKMRNHNVINKMVTE